MTDFVDSSTEKIAKGIMANRKTIWLVWSVDVNNIVSLRAICTKQTFANVYRKYLIHDERLMKVWIEKTITNHLYGNAAFEIHYGIGPIKYK